MPLLDKVTKANTVELRFVTPFGSHHKIVGTDYASMDVLHKTMLYKGRLYPIHVDDIIYDDIVLGIGPLKLATMGNYPYMYVNAETFESMSWKNKDDKTKKIDTEMAAALVARHQTLNFLSQDREQKLHKLLTIFAVTACILGVAVIIVAFEPIFIPYIQQVTKPIFGR